MSEDIENELKGIPKEQYGNEFEGHLLEQYKAYVLMADKVSQRREMANTVFLTINTALVAILGLLSPRAARFGRTSKAVVAISGLTLCYAWYRLVRSYRDLNSGKFRVVHAIEKCLPIKPYDAEWTSLGRGQNPKKYLPFTDIETKVPMGFFIIYVSLIAIALIPSGHPKNTEPGLD